MPENIYKSKANKNSSAAKRAVKYSFDGKLYNSLAEYNAAKAAKAAAKAGNAKGVAKVAAKKKDAELKKIKLTQGLPSKAAAKKQIEGYKVLKNQTKKFRN
jgi:hypothetical protein